MKRFTLPMLAACALALLGACTTSAEKASRQADDFRTRIELTDDTDSLRILVEQAVAYAQALADRGRVDEAAVYLHDIQDAVAAKTPSMACYFDSACATIDALPVARADSAAIFRATHAADTLRPASIR